MAFLVIALFVFRLIINNKYKNSLVKSRLNFDFRRNHDLVNCEFTDQDIMTLVDFI